MRILLNLMVVPFPRTMTATRSTATNAVIEGEMVAETETAEHVEEILAD